MPAAFVARTPRQTKPHFEPGNRVDALANNGTLHSDTAAVFRADGVCRTS